MGLKAAGTLLEAPETGAFSVGSKYQHGTYRGDEQVASEGRRRVKMQNEKGFWEGGVTPNTCSDIRTFASFQQ